MQRETILLCLAAFAVIGNVTAVRIIIHADLLFNNRKMDESSCPNGTRYCDTNKCLREDYWCDGFGDCDRDWDEKFCTKCSPRGFFCDNHCIREVYRCDGTPDCDDGADEANCGVIPESDLFTCSDNKTRRKIARCDGNVDCKGDEQGCSPETCQDGAFWCKMLQFTRCWPQNFRCDAKPWCEDNSDETGCSFEVEEVIVQRTTTTTTPAPPKGRRPEECSPGSRWCLEGDTGRCLRDEFWCDGHGDCNESVDEMNCTTCSRHGFHCDNKCIRRAYKCDASNDCTDGADEKDCPDYAARLKMTRGVCEGETRIRSFTRCDGYIDCEDEEDEEGCTQCVLGAHLCGGGGCVPASDICDGVYNCNDRSDEDSCAGVGAMMNVTIPGQSKP